MMEAEYAIKNKAVNYRMNPFQSILNSLYWHIGCSVNSNFVQFLVKWKYDSMTILKKNHFNRVFSGFKQVTSAPDASRLRALQRKCLHFVPCSDQKSEVESFPRLCKFVRFSYTWSVLGWQVKGRSNIRCLNKATAELGGQPRPAHRIWVTSFPSSWNQ